MKLLILNATNQSITAVLSGAITTTQPDFVATYADMDATSLTEAVHTGTLNSTTPVTVVASPASSTRRVIKDIVIFNRDTAAITLTLSFVDGASTRVIGHAVLQVNETLTIEGSYDASGALKTTVPTIAASAITGQVSAAQGGTNLDTSAATGIPKIVAGVWSIITRITAALGGTGIDTSGSSGVPSIAAGVWSVLTQLTAALGGTGIDTSASTGIPKIVAGTWSVITRITAALGGTGIDTSASTGVPTIASGVWSVLAKLSLALGGTNADLSATGGTGQYLKQLSSGGAVTVGSISDAELPSTLSSHTISGGTISGAAINSSSVGSTTPASGTFTNLAWKNGSSFVGNLNQSNTGNRTYTFPDASTNIVGDDTTQTLINKTIGVSQLSGAVAIANGGTGQTAKTAAMDALSPTTTKGDLIASDGSHNVRLAVGADGTIPYADSSAANGITYRGPSLPDYMAFGDGTDGNVTVNTTITLTRDMYYNNLTIGASAVINAAGYRIFVAGVLDITAAPAGWLKNNGVVGASAVGGLGGTGNVIGNGTSGGNGGAPTNTSGSGVGGTNILGGNGGNAGRSGGNALFGASTATLMGIHRWLVDFPIGQTGTSVQLQKAGNGGSGGTSGNTAGGAGGGGGGGVYLAARTISRGGSTTAAGIQANGGAGEAPTNSGSTSGPGGGGGGGGGFVFLCYRYLTGSTAANVIQVSGGVGGKGGNSTGGTAGTGGSGGDSGAVTVIDLTAASITVYPPVAGSAGSANTTTTGGAGGAGGTNPASI